MKTYLDFISDYGPTTQERAIERGNLFSVIDHVLVKRAVQSALTDEEAEIVILRFWELKFPHEIAEVMEQTTPMIVRKLRTALEKVKNYCVIQPEFSRYVAVPAPRSSSVA